MLYAVITDYVAHNKSERLINHVIKQTKKKLLEEKNKSVFYKLHEFSLRVKRV